MPVLEKHLLIPATCSQREKGNNSERSWCVTAVVLMSCVWLSNRVADMKKFDYFK